MRTNITTTTISQLPVTGKQYDVRDAKIPGFMVRVNAKGSMTYICEYSRGRRVKIARVGVMRLAVAREKALDILASAANGDSPRATREASLALSDKKLTLKRFIEERYAPWAHTQRRSGDDSVRRIKTCFFPPYAHKPIEELNPALLDAWRTDRLNAGLATETLNRDIATFKAALSKAVEWELIDVHPLARLKLLKRDGTAKVRYLSSKEEARLRGAMEAREKGLRAARQNGNEWRARRDYSLFPNYPDGDFVDYLKPMVLVSLNTGVRQGELFDLEWENVDLDRKLITIVGDKAKSGKTRHVPLNQEALEALKIWKQQSESEEGLLFSGRTGERLNNVRKAWMTLLDKAEIKDFRWHDMRHTFASKLVMRGVDLNTVRELLGHADIKMTLRYAHLAPEYKAGAVEKLLDSANA